MKKILTLSFTVASLLVADGNETISSIDAQLAAEKVDNKVLANFTPDISLILDIGYTKESLDYDTEHVEIPGLVHGGGEGHAGHSHAKMTGNEGFALNYAELTIGASADNYFDVMAVLHISENDIEIEEGYATTSNLPFHLKAKLGKFKSNFGYLNVKHAHFYHFNDSPLVYNALLGDHGINEKGVQLQYVFPTSIYMMAGAELLQGENEQSFGYEGFLDVGDAEVPSLMVGYLKSSFDIVGGTLLAGISMAQGDSRINHLEDLESPHAFAGDTTLYGMDLTYKKYFAFDQAISWQSEYIFREMDGLQYLLQDDSSSKSVSMNKKQAGFYTQLVYQHDRNYRAGIRYSGFTKNDVTVNNINTNKPDDLYVVSGMLEYDFSEFSRLRVQYNHNSSLYTEDGLKNNKDEILIQFNYAIGEHGAHAF